MVDQGTNGRPHSSNWRALHAEGILWDGQIFVAGAGVELPLRLIATNQRIAFAKGGAFVLDVPRDWLEPTPYLNPDSTISMTIDAGEGERPERLQLIIRDGRRFAVDLVAALTSAKPVIHGRSGTIYVPEPLKDVPEPPMARGRRSAQASRSRAQNNGEPIAALDSDDFPPLVEVPVRSKSIQYDEDLPPAVIDQAAAIEAMQAGRENSWPLQPISSMSNRTSRHARRIWAIRLSGLLLLLALAAGIGAGRLPEIPGKEIASHIPETSINAPFSGDDPTQTPEQAVAQNVEPTATSSLIAADTAASGSFAGMQPTTPPSQTAIALGVGGMEEDPETVAPTQTPDPTETSLPTATATATATEAPVIEVAEVVEPTATEEPVIVIEEPEPTATSEPTEEPEPTATSEPTEEPTATSEPTSTNTTAPTETSEPVESTATLEPSPEATATSEPLPTQTRTTAPTATPTPTGTPTSTPEPTATPSATPTPTELPTFPVQAETLGRNELPLQAFTDSGFRFTVEGATRGATIDDVALTAVSGAEWVLILVNAENWSNTAESLGIADFQLLLYGDFGVEGASPHSVTKVIAETMALNPALGSTDSALFSPDDAHRIALVYLIRPDTTVMQLTIGDNTIDLGPSLGQPLSPLNLGEPPASPELMEVTVLKVLDGQSILVESENGGRAKVRYLGVAAPLSGICYADESRAANEALVGGKTVFLEREFENRVPGSRIVRDVWIESSGGGLTLVAAELAATGSVVSEPMEPDIRFSGWIQAAADGAQATGLGVWAECGGLQTPTPETAVEVDALGSRVAEVTPEAAVTVEAQSAAIGSETLVQPASVATETPFQEITTKPQVIEQA